MAKLRNKLEENEKQIVIDMFHQGYGGSTIARLLCVSGGPVLRLLKDEGLKRTRKEGLDARLKNGGFASKPPQIHSQD